MNFAIALVIVFYTIKLKIKVFEFLCLKHFFYFYVIKQEVRFL